VRQTRPLGDNPTSPPSLWHRNLVCSDQEVLAEEFNATSTITRLVIYAGHISEDEKTSVVRSLQVATLGTESVADLESSTQVADPRHAVRY